MSTAQPQPVVPRPAATVIVLRPCPEGVETFMVRRDPRSRFAADAFVFPGGTVQPDDYFVADQERLAGLSVAEAHRRFVDRGGDPPEEPALSLALHVAAVRELFEEAGILLVDGLVDGVLGGLDAGLVDEPGDADSAPSTETRASDLATLESDRRSLQAGRLSFASLLASRRLTVASPRLIYFSHWITPAPSPRRYDTRFFVGELPDGQEATHCGLETVDGIWVSPRLALERYEQGTMVLVSVTRDHLQRLAAFPTPAAVLDFASRKRIRTVNPLRQRDAWENGGDDW